MDLRRWTPLTYLFPRRYVDRSDFWDGFDIERWSSASYEWVSDPWNGYRDFAKRPATTIADGEGDCEDYALVAMSWAVANGRSGIGLAFCVELPYPWPRHVVAYDDERVYSSGYIVEKDVDQWIADSKYAYAFKRRVN